MAKLGESFIGGLSEEKRAEYLGDLASKESSSAIARKWNLSAMAVSRHRRDPDITRVRTKISMQALERGMKKAGIGKDLEHIVTRSEEIYRVAAGDGVAGAKKDLQAMIKAMELQLSVVRTKGEVTGELGGPKEKEAAQPPQLTINALIHMPRTAPFSARAQLEGEVIDVEEVDPEEEEREWDGTRGLEEEE